MRSTKRQKKIVPSDNLTVREYFRLVEEEQMREYLKDVRIIITCRRRRACALRRDRNLSCLVWHGKYNNQTIYIFSAKKLPDLGW